MRWKTKATLQNAISRLPSRSSYVAYYWLQRHFGGLRHINPIERLQAGVDTWKRIEQLGCDPVGKAFFEVGTGRVPMTPLAYWLMGASSVTTVDLNPYIKPELTDECIEYIMQHRETIESLFGSYLQTDRLDQLLRWYARGAFDLNGFLALCDIRYIAPGDASRTGLEAKSIDFHTSFNVFEHIPQPVLIAIMQEGNRLISDNGLFVHRVDYSDHFSHSDPRISPINFLQYSDSVWRRYADNRYMYMNRLRHDDFLDLFAASGQRVVIEQPLMQEDVRKLIQCGALKVDERFARKSASTLATTESWIVTKKSFCMPMDSGALRNFTNEK